MKDTYFLVEEMRSRAQQTGAGEGEDAVLSQYGEVLGVVDEEVLAGVLIDALTMLDMVLSDHEGSPSTRDRTLRLMIDLTLHGIRNGFAHAELRDALGKIIAAGYAEV